MSVIYKGPTFLICPGPINSLGSPVSGRTFWINHKETSQRGNHSVRIFINCNTELFCKQLFIFDVFAVFCLVITLQSYLRRQKTT